MTGASEFTLVTSRSVPASPTTRDAGPPDEAVKPFKWIKLWAWLGAIHLAFATFVLVRWIDSGQMHRTPNGPDKPPAWIPDIAHAGDIVSPIVGISLVYWFLVRQWRKEGHLTADGMIVIASLTMYFPYDCMQNYITNHLSYNTYSWNVGSWLDAIPGELAPHAHLLPEPVLFAFPGYTWGIALPALAGAWLMRKMKAKWTRLTFTQLILSVMAVYVVFDFCLEVPFMFLRTWGYPGAVGSLTLFHGTVFAFPIYEGLFVGPFLTALAGMRYFVDDRGRLFLERGINGVRATNRQKTGVRVLASMGYGATIMIIYTVVIQFLAIHGSAYPTNYPSYLQDGIAGRAAAISAPAPLTLISHGDGSLISQMLR